MTMAVHSTSPVRGDQIRYHLLFGATYPLFCLAGAVQRLVARAPAEEGAPRLAQRSVFAEARDNASIAISYALMARTTLQTFARHNRTERLP
ncbi:MAG: hypothetical protein ABSG83_09585 [Roseiarcus sp.]